MPLNSPTLETERLLLRRFEARDDRALFALLREPETTRFLPLFPLRSPKEAGQLLEQYQEEYREAGGCNYAICLRGSPDPIGYVKAERGDSHDFGYALQPAYWHRGIVSEASRAAIAQLQREGCPYITATHDVHNLRSGAVMRRLGMRYQYSYEECWQPKNIMVTFRLYQLDLDGRERPAYRAYWDRYPVHFVEPGL